MNETPSAFSYLRFSTPEQAKGDSIRRQTDLRDAWLARNQVTLDTSLTLEDKGISGFTGEHRNNPDRHALAAFLRAVERGKIRKGSYLIVESLDRLTREDILPAMTLMLNLIQAEIRIVQLLPSEMVYDQKTDPMRLMMMIMELSRGHSESRMKSERNGKAWQKRLERARKGEVVLTRVLPAWIELREGKMVVIPVRAATVRHIFQLSRAGYGLTRILKALVQEGIPSFGSSGVWNKPYIRKILNDRRVLGDFQPRKGDGSKDGEAIPDYFPGIVTLEEWEAAREGTVRRGRDVAHKTNNSSKHIDVFAGLVKDARDGGSMYCGTRIKDGKHTRVLLSSKGEEGHLPKTSFPYRTFERAILARLSEIDPADLAGEDTAPTEVEALSGELRRVNSELGEIAAYLEGKGFSATLGKRITDLESRREELVEKLEDARRKASTPLATAWGEARTLLESLDNAKDPDDVRIRIRTALRRTVQGICLLVAPRGYHRLAIVQVNFQGSWARTFTILHRPRRANTAMRWWAGSGGKFRVGEAGVLDLRKPEDAEYILNLELANFHPEIDEEQAASCISEEIPLE